MAVTAGPSPTDAVPVRSWRAWLNQYSWLGMGFAFTLSVFYLVMFVIPFGTAIWLSFHNWDYIQRPVFVNTRNFDKLLGDPGFWNALWTTVRFSAVEIFVALSLALLLALALSHLRPVYQYTLLAIYNLPVIMPGVVSVLLWKWLYRTNGGAFNAILESVGLPAQPFSRSPDQALWCITLMVVWIFLGNSSIVLLAAINEVPDSLLEAAQLDGASAWKRFTAVTLPLIQPAMAYQVVTSIIGTMQMFEPFQLMPGPGHSTRTLSLYTYQLGFEVLNLGYGAAVSIAMFVILLSATLFELQRRRRSWDY
ncbi:MAG: sugar ABC transporter permease [Caldilineaceae bacterium]|nr:sugar ABC transporter permease [Caldilineaceae bacterium]